jgi:small conductance mechanosensitive channel
MDRLLDYILLWDSAFLTVITFIVIYYVVKVIFDRVKKALDKKDEDKSEASLLRTILLFLIVLIGTLAVISVLPIDETLRKEISGLIGIVVSGVLALSATTFIGNALAGIMIRAIGNFKPGDRIEVGDQVGLVSERGLFHTEIQTENRDLVTLPNMFLVTNPVKVSYPEGTFLCATVSLGYDVNRSKVAAVLKGAALKAELTEPFVRITELGDFSVVYKVYGLLKDLEKIIRAESNLYAMILDELHTAGIEIVSPSFMNQRQVKNTVFIPEDEPIASGKKMENSDSPENLVFDKATKAGVKVKKEELEAMDQEIKELKVSIEAAEDKAPLRQKLEELSAKRKELADQIADREEGMEDDK